MPDFRLNVLSAAAQKSVFALYLTEAAVMHHIRALEEFDVLLFAR